VTEPVKGTPRDFVYAGHRLDKKGDLFDALCVVGEDGKLGELSLYKASRAMRILGGIYRGARFDDAMSYGLKSAKWTGERWDDKPEVEVWRARSDDADIAYKQARLEANADRSSLIEKSMEPVRQLYAETIKRGDYNGAQALERAVLRALHKRPKE
jgi:hypothetical protein